jgi:hypothetical protein
MQHVPSKMHFFVITVCYLCLSRLDSSTHQPEHMFPAWYHLGACRDELVGGHEDELVRIVDLILPRLNQDWLAKVACLKR